jgi:hypothetical protein
MSEFGPSQTPDTLQFEHAELLPEASANASSGPLCVVCKRPTGSTYFHAQGQVVCPNCAEGIRSHQKAPPHISLGRAVLFGAGAALAGCLLYAAVSIITGLEVGLIAIAVGIMVGKAIRHASHGRGGRPQQILAVVLTYFAITTSYIPVILYHVVKNPPTAQQRQAKRAQVQDGSAPVTTSRGGAARPLRSFGGAILFLLMMTAVAPFLSLSSGFSGLITLFIIFIGLQRAWKLTGRPEILVMGPYEATPAE